ncbi:MAG: hypothetical protein GF350_12755 [Chitinivibrionales bacterium]|nr:hypothetical protein [Chitinivibrionales bacterium]
MTENGDPLNIKKNFIALALLVVAILLIIDVILRVSPGVLRPDSEEKAAQAISAVGHHHEFENGSSFYIYTIFESDGDVYQCWWDQKQWNQKKVTNYKGPTLPHAE